MEREEIAIKQVKRNLNACSHVLTYGNTSVWNRLKSYSTSLIIVNTNKSVSNDDRILRAIKQEEENQIIVDKYLIILEQLNKETAEVVRYVYFDKDLTIEDISEIMSMNERTVQRLLRDAIHQIAVLDNDIDYSIYDLERYYSQSNKIGYVIKKTVNIIIKNQNKYLDKVITEFCQPLSKLDLIDFYSNRNEEFSNYQKRKIQQAVIIIAYCMDINNLDDITFIDMMRRTRLSENKINKIIEFKRKVLPIKDSSIIKKNIKAKL